MAAWCTLDRDSLLRVTTLCSIRDVQALRCCNHELYEVLKGDDVWQALAVKTWGHHVRSLARVPPGGWAAWTAQRSLSTKPAPVSPLDLIQEAYQRCAFQHIVACLLCTRTSGSSIVRGAIDSFLERYPTPSAILDASDQGLLQVPHALGLQAVRLDAVRGVARDFLALDWRDPTAFKHCGPFVDASWRIFCRASRTREGIHDKNLLSYLRWRLHGSVEDGAPRQHGAAGKQRRKRRAEAPVEAGTLRSGRRRGGSAAKAAPPAGERRVTRASQPAPAVRSRRT